MSKEGVSRGAVHSILFLAGLLVDHSDRLLVDLAVHQHVGNHVAAVVLLEQVVIDEEVDEAELVQRH